MVIDINVLIYIDNCGWKCKGNLICLCLYFFVLINLDISVKGGVVDWIWYIVEVFYVFEYVFFR